MVTDPAIFTPSRPNSIRSLHRLKQRLEATEATIYHQCLYVGVVACTKSSEQFTDDERILEWAMWALKLPTEKVPGPSFVNIVRCLFCETHRSWKHFGAYGDHFKSCWGRASFWTKQQVLAAFRGTRKEFAISIDSQSSTSKDDSHRITRHSNWSNRDLPNQHRKVETTHFRVPRALSQVSTASSVPSFYSPMRIAERIHKILRQPVQPQSYIYVLKAPRYFKGHDEAMSKGERWIKIGYAKDVDQRIRDLRYSCGIKDLDEYSKCLVPAYLAAKAERLCHVELINFKRILNCGKCKNGPRHMNHKEWFAVSEELATSIVQRWCKFAHQDAYDEEDGNLDDHWRRMASSDNLCGIQGSRVPQDLEEARVHLKRAGENYDSWLNGASGKAPRSSK